MTEWITAVYVKEENVFSKIASLVLMVSFFENSRVAKFHITHEKLFFIDLFITSVILISRKIKMDSPT